MGKQRNRPKHLQHRTWFNILVDDIPRVVRPVDGEEWFGQAPLSTGVIYLIDEASELVGVMLIENFEKDAKRVGGK